MTLSGEGNNTMSMKVRGGRRGDVVGWFDEWTVGIWPSA